MRISRKHVGNEHITEAAAAVSSASRSVIVDPTGRCERRATKERKYVTGRDDKLLGLEFVELDDVGIVNRVEGRDDTVRDDLLVVAVDLLDIESAELDANVHFEEFLVVLRYSGLLVRNSLLKSQDLFTSNGDGNLSDTLQSVGSVRFNALAEGCLPIIVRISSKHVGNEHIAEAAAAVSSTPRSVIVDSTGRRERRAKKEVTGRDDKLLGLEVVQLDDVGVVNRVEGRDDTVRDDLLVVAVDLLDIESAELDANVPCEEFLVVLRYSGLLVRNSLLKSQDLFTSNGDGNLSDTLQSVGSVRFNALAEGCLPIIVRISSKHVGNEHIAEAAAAVSSTPRSVIVDSTGRRERRAKKEVTGRDDKLLGLEVVQLDDVGVVNRVEGRDDTVRDDLLVVAVDLLDIESAELDANVPCEEFLVVLRYSGLLVRNSLLKSQDLFTSNGDGNLSDTLQSVGSVRFNALAEGCLPIIVRISSKHVGNEHIAEAAAAVSSTPRSVIVDSTGRRERRAKKEVTGRDDKLLGLEVVQLDDVGVVNRVEGRDDTVRDDLLVVAVDLLDIESAELDANVPCEEFLVVLRYSGLLVRNSLLKSQDLFTSNGDGNLSDTLQSVGSVRFNALAEGCLPIIVRISSKHVGNEHIAEAAAAVSSTPRSVIVDSTGRRERRAKKEVTGRDDKLLGLEVVQLDDVGVVNRVEGRDDTVRDDLLVVAVDLLDIESAELDANVPCEEFLVVLRYSGLLVRNSLLKSQDLFTSNGDGNLSDTLQSVGSVRFNALAEGCLPIIVRISSKHVGNEHIAEAAAAVSSTPRSVIVDSTGRRERRAKKEVTGRDDKLLGLEVVQLDDVGVVNRVEGRDDTVRDDLLVVAVDLLDIESAELDANVPCEEFLVVVR